ncbi:MAG: hypothetical protein JF614_17160 [Acidobacteria bacterium]|jgi:hypothetical protein|nr:hypothetical protein [Acidobacteriota bacterium]
MNHVSRLPIVAVIGSGDPDHGNPELAAAVGPNRAGRTLGIIPRSPAVDEADRLRAAERPEGYALDGRER